MLTTSSAEGVLTTTSWLAHKILLGKLAFAILLRLSETVIVFCMKSEILPGVVHSLLLQLTVTPSACDRGVLSRTDIFNFCLFVCFYFRIWSSIPRTVYSRGARWVWLWRSMVRQDFTWTPHTAVPHFPKKMWT